MVLFPPRMVQFGPAVNEALLLHQSWVSLMILVDWFHVWKIRNFQICLCRFTYLSLMSLPSKFWGGIQNMVFCWNCWLREIEQSLASFLDETHTKCNLDRLRWKRSFETLNIAICLFSFVKWTPVYQINSQLFHNRSCLSAFEKVNNFILCRKCHHGAS